MKFVDLEKAVSEHSGVFRCTRIGGHDEPVYKEFHFEHVYEPCMPEIEVPDIGMLKDFYSTFSSLTLYFHKESGDAAFYIANPGQWDSLLECFHDWMSDLSEEEEFPPEWTANCIAIGEIPKSGNCLLMPTSGEMAGHIVEFEHDGFEFVDRASNIIEFVVNMLEPDSRILMGIATHMTFSESDPWEQWWVVEMRDNKGRVVVNGE